MPKIDLLDQIVAQLREAVPDYPAEKLLETARRIRQDLGGTEAYIKKAPALGKALSLGQQLAAGVPLDQAFVRAGISRSYGYVLLHRRWRFR